MQQPNNGYPVQNTVFPDTGSNFAPPLGQAGHLPGPSPGQPPRQKTSNKMGIILCSVGIIVGLALPVYFWLEFDGFVSMLDMEKCWHETTVFPVSNTFYKSENDNRGNAVIFHGETMEFR